MSSQIERVLGGPAKLITSFSLTAALNTDLKHTKYSAPAMSISEQLRGSRKKEKLGLPPLKAEPVSLPIPPPRESKKIGLKRRLENLDDMSDSEIAKGFLDENGEEVWIVEDVLAYCPKKGYKVKWVGWPKPTWNCPKNMPRDDPWLNARMAKARYMQCRQTQ